MQRARTGQRAPQTRSPFLLVSAVALTLFPLLGREASAAADAKSSCIKCHSDPDFHVTAKKLYDYFQEWEISVHRQEGVGCEDCHGGNPDVSDKKGAHGTEVSSGMTAGGAVSFENIPSTCGTCHDDIYEGYLQSDHFDHLLDKKQEKQGPNCVTCHGSMNATVLNVNNVKNACGQCHNEETANHPDIPDKASDILNRFLSINRFYRYIGIRGDPAETRAFFAVMDQRISDLSTLWHTFDLPKIDKETQFVLNLLKTKREEVRKLQHPKEP